MIDLTMFHTVDAEDNNVELPRPETKDYGDIIQVVRHWQGKKEGKPVIDKFIEMYLSGVQWNWYEQDYKPWLAECETVKAYNDALAADDDGHKPEPMPEPKLQERPAMETVSEFRKREAGLLKYVP